MKVLLVSPGQTDWSRQQRIKGNLDVPLSPAGMAAVEKLTRKLGSGPVRIVYCPTTLDGRQTARIIARITHAKVCPRKELNDLDQGLWQGLTVEELRRRHPHVYARWVQSPNSVLPPGGEDLSMAFGRVRTVVDELKRKRRDEAVLCVVPSSLRKILACHLGGKTPEDVTDLAGEDGDIDIIEL